MMNRLTFERPSSSSPRNGFHMPMQLILVDSFLCTRHNPRCWKSNGEQDRQKRSLKELAIE